MKAVMISIRPKYTAMIFSKSRLKRKSIEIRKTSPLLPVPFKCYVYETGNGVIGEFICKGIKIICKRGFMGSFMPPAYPVDDDFFSKCCLTYEELERYMQGREIHAWRVDDPVKYDIPKKLSDFSIADKKTKVMKAPQSWFYVEEIPND